MQDFSLNDIRTLKHLNKEKLDFYIQYLNEYKKVDLMPLEEVSEADKTVLTLLNKNAAHSYKYTKTILDIGDIFKEYPCGGEPGFDTANNIRTILEDGSYVSKMTPNLINFYINQVVFQETFEPGVVALNVEKDIS